MNEEIPATLLQFEGWYNLAQLKKQSIRNYSFTIALPVASCYGCKTCGGCSCDSCSPASCSGCSSCKACSG